MWMWGFVYYIYPSVLFTIMLAGCIVSASLLHGQQQRLVVVANQTRLVPFIMKGYVCVMRARQLVPGDVIVVQPGTAVCDMVLLQGNALAEESRLTGEVMSTLLIFLSCIELTHVFPRGHVCKVLSVSL